MLLAVAMQAGPAAAAPLGPGRASGFFTYRAGTEQGGMRATADRGPGFVVRVEPRTPHVAELVPAARFAVGQLRRYGIGIRFGGVAAAPPAHGTPVPGDIDVTETAAGLTGTCQATSGSEAGAVFAASTVPVLEDVGVATQVNGAVVTFCPDAWAFDEHYVTAIAMHELGHAVGLGHYPGTFHGRVQLMNPVVPDLTAYQPGDVAGLRYLVAETARLRAESVLSGAVESWQIARSGLRFSGWAVVGRTSEFATITVTRDGTPVYTISTSTARPDIVARTHTGWPSPGFDGARAPMLNGRHRYCVVASVPGIPSQRRTLGCRVLSYPPPGVKPSSGAAQLRLPSTSDDGWTVVVLGGAALVLAGFAITYWLRRRSRRA